MMNFLFAQATPLEIVLMLSLSFVAIDRVYDVMQEILGLSRTQTILTKLGVGALNVLIVVFVDGFSSTLMVVTALVSALPVLLISAPTFKRFVEYTVNPKSMFSVIYAIVVLVFFTFAAIGEYLVNDSYAIFMVVTAVSAAVQLFFTIKLKQLRAKLS